MKNFGSAFLIISFLVLASCGGGGGGASFAPVGSSGSSSGSGSGSEQELVQVALLELQAILIRQIMFFRERLKQSK